APTSLCPLTGLFRSWGEVLKQEAAPLFGARVPAWVRERLALDLSFTYSRTGVMRLGLLAEIPAGVIVGPTITPAGISANSPCLITPVREYVKERSSARRSRTQAGTRAPKSGAASCFSTSPQDRKSPVRGQSEVG